MFRLRQSRWRRALVAAFAPYLFLSMFVDFVHVHPLVGTDSTHVSTSGATLSPHTTTVPSQPCAVCQWLRADTGLQTPFGSAVTTNLIATDLVLRITTQPIQSVVLSHDLRGPPRRISA